MITKVRYMKCSIEVNQLSNKENICINVCIIKIHIPRPHDVKNQHMITKMTSQIMEYGQDVILQKGEIMIISNMGNGTRCS